MDAYICTCVIYASICCIAQLIKGYVEYFASTKPQHKKKHLINGFRCTITRRGYGRGCCCNKTFLEETRMCRASENIGIYRHYLCAREKDVFNTREAQIHRLVTATASPLPPSSSHIASRQIALFAFVILIQRWRSNHDIEARLELL